MIYRDKPTYFDTLDAFVTIIECANSRDGPASTLDKFPIESTFIPAWF